MNQGVIFVFYAGKIEWNRAIYLQYLTYPPLVVFTCSPVVDSLAIINERGEPLKPKCIGEIIIRDPAGFSGYDNAPEDTGTTFINGWSRTGDPGYTDDRYLFITGRQRN